MHCEDRAKLIVKLIREVYLSSDHMEHLIKTSKNQLQVTGRKIKRGESFAIAQKHLISDDFICHFIDVFKDFSDEELYALIKIYQSPEMRKFLIMPKAWLSDFFAQCVELFAEEEESVSLYVQS